MRKLGAVAAAAAAAGLMACGDGQRQPAGASGPCASREVGSPISTFGSDPAGELIAAAGAPGGSAVLVGAPAAASVYQSMGSIAPTEGVTFAWLSTGVAGAGTPAYPGSIEPGTAFGLPGCSGTDTFDCASLSYTFTAPGNAASVRFDFHFLTAEFPEYVGASMNDSFTVALSSSSHGIANVAFDGAGNPISVNNAFFALTDCSEFIGTGFDVFEDGGCDGGSTGLLSTLAPIVGGETVTLTFQIQDSGDQFYDSAVMLDGIATTEIALASAVTEPCE